MWNTSLTIYRRNATIAVSRTNLALLQAKDLRLPTLQLVQPTDLFQAFNAILTPLTLDTDFGDCPAGTPQFQLTKFLYIYLNQTTYQANPSVNIPQDYLRNLLATPLYLCNLMMLTTADSPETIQPGLLPENYISGSYAIPVRRAVTGTWTIWVYACSYGALLLILGLVCILTSKYEIPKSSDFPIADLLLLTSPEEMAHDEVDAGTQGNKIYFEDVFSGLQPGDNKGILKRADQVRVRLVTKDTSA